MHTFKHLLLCTVPFLAAASITAKTFSGRVVDDETGKGLAGVSITLSNGTEKTTTDPEGKFSFDAEVSVDAARIRPGSRNILRWRGAEHLFDLTSAPDMQSIALYDLRGRRLFFQERIPGAGQIPLPGLSGNMYLLHIGFNDGTGSSVNWTALGNNAVFTFNGSCSRGGSLPKRNSIADSLVFEKQEYRTRRKAVDTDSTYAAMLIKMKPVIGSQVFDEDTVRTYRLYFTAENLSRLLDFSKLVTNTYTVNPVYVPARLEVNDRKLDSIAVRFRGDQSIWDCIANGKRKKGVSYPQYGFGNGDICAKFTMKFDFNRYNRDFRLYGLKALNFRSMSADPTKMHEKLGFALFSDMGIVSPRCAYARLFVNDTLWGLFGVTEEIDGRFTKSRYPQTGDGNLYKEIWPTDKLKDSDISDGMVTNNDPEDNPDFSDFAALRALVTASETDSGNFREKAGALVDLPHLVRYIVVDRAIMNFDGIMALYGTTMRHNYFWYHDEESELFKLIPWDLDKVFIYPEPNFWTNNEANGINVVPNWNVVNSSYGSFRCKYDPGSGGGGYDVAPIDKDKFLRLFRSATWSDFRLQGRAFLDTVFTQEKVDARIGRWRTLIAGAAGEDPTVDSVEWAVMVDSLSRSVPLFRTNLKMMIDTLIVR